MPIATGVGKQKWVDRYQWKNRAHLNFEEAISATHHMNYQPGSSRISLWSQYRILTTGLLYVLAVQLASPLALAELPNKKSVDEFVGLNDAVKFQRSSKTGSSNTGLGNTGLGKKASALLSAQTKKLQSVADTIPQGIAKPIQRVTMSAPVQGGLVELVVAGGDQVKKDQILAVMDNRVALAAVRAAEVAANRTAAIEHSRHALGLARSLFERHLKLKELEAGSEFELEQAKTQLDQAQASLASALEEQLQAKRNLGLEKARLESHNLRAPFNGRVLLVDSTVGTTLTPADKFLTLVNLDLLEAEMFLPLELFGQLESGETYELKALDPINRTVKAELVFVSPTIDPATRTFRCLFKINNQDRKLPAGFGVRFDPSL